MVQGRCECGAITIEVTGPMTEFSHCHCSQCRRIHGSAFGTFVTVARADLRFKSGIDKLQAYQSSADFDRHFCKVCGSKIMIADKRYPDLYYLSLGLIDGDPDLPPPYHIFVGSKAPWFDITDDAPQFDGDVP